LLTRPLQLPAIEDFHAKSERGVKQEIFAHFALITMNRIFTNKADVDLNQPNYPTADHKSSSRENQKERPGRSYARKSMKPGSKWQPSKEKKKKIQILAT